MDPMVQILVQREKQTFIGDPAIEVLLDEVKVGEVKSGGFVVAQASPGVHKLDFVCSFRSTTINADFQQDANITLRFNRGSGEIDAVQSGAVEVHTHFDWENQPRDPGKVYPDKRKTSPFVAMILSILLVGLGQMINGQLIKGLLILIVGIVIGAVTGGIGAPVVWILSAIDAYMCANKLKQGKPIGRFSFF